MLNIFEALSARKATKLVISDLIKEIASDGSLFTYYRIILGETLDEISGKTKYHNPSTGSREAIYAYDVAEVRIREDVLQQFQDEFSANLKLEDGKICGTYEGDLFLDVSLGEHVWLDFKSLGARERDRNDAKRSTKFRKP